MSSTHKVTTDALETLGTIIGEGAGRDAIHLAVEPVVAAHVLRPGEDVGFVAGGVGRCQKPVGIVDPFLKDAVQPGQRFWLVVYPRQITSLRHVWTHPEFEGALASSSLPKETLAASEQWLRNFCAQGDCPDYDTIIAVATEGESGEGYQRCYIDEDSESFHVGGRDAHGEIPPEFWNHLEIVTGKKMTKRVSYFTCGC